MTLKIIHKNNTSAGQAPAPSDLDIGEIAVNSADAKLYIEDNNGAIQSFTNDNDAVTVQRFTQAASGAVTRTVESKLRDAVSVKDFGAVGDGITDDAISLQKAADYANSTGCTILVPHTPSFYSVTSGIAIYGGTWVFEDNALIKNVSNDSVNFWKNTAAFVGSYFGYNAADGINAEVSYDIEETSVGLFNVEFVLAADSANFSVGDIVYITDANNYSGTTFAIASHVSEVTKVTSGSLELADPYPLNITQNGSIYPKIRKATNALATTEVGKPVTAKLATNVTIQNGQFESVESSDAQVVHVSCHKSSLHFAKIKGAELLGVNPCSYSSISLEDGQYHVRALELAYHHSNVNLPIFRARREKIPTPSTKLSVPFSISEYGNLVECGLIDIADYSWTGDTDNASVSFYAPLNRAQTIRVFGSQATAVAIGADNDRAQNTSVDCIHVLKTEKIGVDINASNVTIGKLIVDTIPLVTGAQAVRVRNNVTGTIIESANLGNGVGNGQRFSIEDQNGPNTTNVYGNIINHYSQNSVNDRGFTPIAGTGADNSLKTYTVPAGTTTKLTEFKIRVFGNIAASSTAGAKTLSITVNSVAIATINLLAAQTGFISVEASLFKAGSDAQVDYISSAQSVAGPANTSGSLAINTEITDLDIKLVANMNASDTFNLRAWDVIPRADQFVY